MLQTDFTLFNVESIHKFNSNFVNICSVNSHPFGFPSTIKQTTLENLKFIVNILSNQENKFAFIWVDEDGALEISS